MPYEGLIAELSNIVGHDNCLSDPADLIIYGYDNSTMAAVADVVVLPNSTTQIIDIVTIANKYKIPIITKGGSTNTCGATVPTLGGIIIATQKLNKIIRIAPNDRYAIVQPGITNSNLQTALKPFNMFWPPDPGSAKTCTIGGNLACNAAGPSSVKYGVTREHVLGLEFITGDGQLIKAGSCTTKSVVGYDLTRLLIGSEGTLGIITEAILKIHPIPEATYSIKANYKCINIATEVITRLMSQDTIPSALELMDAQSLNLMKKNPNLHIPSTSQALLLINISSSAEHIDSDANKIYQILYNNGNCLDICMATNSYDSDKIWQARKLLSPKLKYIAPNKINEDVVVPVSKLPCLIRFIEKLSVKYNLPIVNFGHAGNGNIHVNILINNKDLKQKQDSKICLQQIFTKVLELNGSISGEHGIGLVKSNYIKHEIGIKTINLNKHIKSVFDPNNLLNPQLFANF
jgi:D-lactate dehydrogenase